MKCSDIPDRHVIELAAHKRAHPWTAPGVVAGLVAEGVPLKLARAKVGRLERRGLLDSGVSSDLAWPTERGLRPLC